MILLPKENAKSRHPLIEVLATRESRLIYNFKRCSTAPTIAIPISCALFG
jgi:hypothetical protein